MLKTSLRNSILFLFISCVSITVFGQMRTIHQPVSGAAAADSSDTAYSSNPSGPFDHLVDFGLILYSVPVGLWEAVTVGELFLPVNPYVALASAVAAGAGYPVWVGSGLRKMTSRNLNSHHRLRAPGLSPAFYVSGSLQYARFLTTQSEAGLNGGFAIEYWYPLTKRVAVRTGLHLSKRTVKVNHKTFYDPDYMENEMLAVNLKYVSWETYGPVELIVLWPQSTDATIFAAFGFSVVLPSYEGVTEKLGTVPASENFDYTTDDRRTEDPSLNRLYTASIGLIKKHWITELQYTLDGAKNTHLVHNINIDDPVITLRFRLSYRLPLKEF